jgi:tetratricopeptide (TPR) repeat protein
MVEAPPAGSPDVLPGNSAEENYRLGLSLYEAGRVDDALAPLQAASRAPKLRFLAASLVGRIYRDRGEFAPAVEWLERAAQAPAPTPDDGHMLLFDLAEALEQAGETSRALAVCMELQADAGNYRDVAARIDRLARVRARG